MVLVHLQPVVIVIVCHAIATDGGVGGVLIMGSVLPGYMFRYQYCLVGGLEATVFGSIRWCVWSFRPSSPLRLPHLKCLLLLLWTQAQTAYHLYNLKQTISDQMGSSKPSRGRAYSTGMWAVHRNKGRQVSDTALCILEADLAVSQDHTKETTTHPCRVLLAPGLQSVSLCAAAAVEKWSRHSAYTSDVNKAHASPQHAAALSGEHLCYERVQADPLSHQMIGFCMFQIEPSPLGSPPLPLFPL